MITISSATKLNKTKNQACLWVLIDSGTGPLLQQATLSVTVKSCLSINVAQWTLIWANTTTVHGQWPISFSKKKPFQPLLRDHFQAAVHQILPLWTNMSHWKPLQLKQDITILDIVYLHLLHRKCTVLWSIGTSFGQPPLNSKPPVFSQQSDNSWQAPLYFFEQLKAEPNLNKPLF